MEIVVSIAGSDPSAGAGIQQDLKTITATGCYGATVITALTAQNTMGVSDVMAVSPSFVAAQLKAVLEDFHVKAVKIGMIPTSEVAESIVEILQGYASTGQIPIVYDPVMVSTSGHRLMENDCVDYVSRSLFPLCTLVTPNLHEAQVLAKTTLKSITDIRTAGKWLVNHYQSAFLLKGGHDDTSASVSTDHLFCTDGKAFDYSSPRLLTRNLHGTGCTLSSAIAAHLAMGATLPKAVAAAKSFVDLVISRSVGHHIGHGNGPLLTVSSLE